MTFSDLEKRKHKMFLEKKYTGTRTSIEQIRYGASLMGTLFGRQIVLEMHKTMVKEKSLGARSVISNFKYINQKMQKKDFMSQAV